MHKRFPFLALLLPAASSAYAQDSVIIEQVGGHNTASVQQQSKTSHKGEDTLLVDKNRPDDFQQQVINDPRISQYGRASEAMRSQFGEENAIAELKLKSPQKSPGAPNSGDMDETNHIDIQQSGKKNHVNATQTGESNRMKIKQKGEENSIVKSQVGRHNVYMEDQNGASSEEVIDNY